MRLPLKLLLATIIIVSIYEISWFLRGGHGLIINIQRDSRELPKAFKMDLEKIMAGLTPIDWEYSSKHNSYEIGGTPIGFLTQTNLGYDITKYRIKMLLKKYNLSGTVRKWSGW